MQSSGLKLGIVEHMQIKLKCKHFLGDWVEIFLQVLETQQPKSDLCQQNLMIQTQSALLFGLGRINTLLSHEFFPNFNAHSTHIRKEQFPNLLRNCSHSTWWQVLRNSHLKDEDKI